jgi:hypothetical protein
MAGALGTADRLAAETAATIDPRRLSLGDAEVGHAVTRFPPEPSAPIDLGHVKAALVNKVVACRYQVRIPAPDAALCRRCRRSTAAAAAPPPLPPPPPAPAPAPPCHPARPALRPQGRCILRYDDTNPERGSAAHVEGYARDLAALGLTFDATTFASDYFAQLYALAEQLIRAGAMYADRTPREQVRAAGRGWGRGRCAQLRGPLPAPDAAAAAAACRRCARSGWRACRRATGS